MSVLNAVLAVDWVAVANSVKIILENVMMIIGVFSGIAASLPSRKKLNEEGHVNTPTETVVSAVNAMALNKDFFEKK